jgi:hypothetical protein
LTKPTQNATNDKIRTELCPQCFYPVFNFPQSIDSKTTSCLADFEEEEEDDFDISLLRLTAFFNYSYLVFVLITGVVHVAEGSDVFFPGWMHIVNALVVMAETTALLIFLIELKGKVSFN